MIPHGELGARGRRLRNPCRETADPVVLGRDTSSQNGVIELLVDASRRQRGHELGVKGRQRCLRAL